MSNVTTSALADPLGNTSKAATPAGRTWLQSALAPFETPRGLWLVAGLACLLASPSLGIGLSTDDHVVSANARADALRNPFTAFGFRPELGLDRNSGYLAWWSSPQLQVKFLRPLSLLSHGDLRLWPHAIWAIHGTNVFLYMLLAAVAWLLYRELLPGAPQIAALAALLFTLDDGHAAAVGWISSRNTLLSALFALAALRSHARARKQGRPGRLKSAGWLALALLSGEGGIAGFSYLIAYELAFETGALRVRVARLWPQASVVAVWVLTYLAGHFGVHGSSFYRELSDPLSVLGEGLFDLPLWLTGLLGPSIIGTALVLPPLSTRLIGAAVIVPVVMVIALNVPRTRENRFFALGVLLSLLPLFTTVPQDRILLMASFGAFGLLASFIHTALHAVRRGVRGLALCMLSLHGAVAPLMFIPLLDSTRPFELGSQAIVTALPKHAPAQVVLVNLPVELLPTFAYYIVREQADRTPPELLQQLYAGSSELTVTRSDESTLEVQAHDGWGAQPIERIFGNVRDMPRTGEVLQLDRLTISVQESAPDGRPMRVQFRFPSSLESPDRLWYVWQGTAPVRWHPPQVGQREVLPALGALSSLPR
jgi:hypothetical protein